VKHVRRLPELPPRRSDAHKGDFGRVLVVAGSREMVGAAVLCARAATRSGAGLVRVALPPELVPLLPLAVPEATTCERRVPQLRRQLAEADAVVIGPGLSTAATTRTHVQTVLDHAAVPVVLDADALNVLAPLAERLASRAPLLLTPHPGEAARLLGTTSKAVQRDRPAAVEQLCRKSGAVTVLKGEGTLVCDGERLFKNRTGNPGMATGGSGDVLGGLLAALLARGLDPFDAACLAVCTHGAAGDRVCRDLGVSGLVASDLCDAIAKELP
jgi:NAD(P)H-hydrate epimerase